MTTPEGRIKAKFNKRIKEIQARYPGRLFVRMPVTRGMGKPLLDYLFCANGKFIAVEAKRDENHKITPQQKATMAEINNAMGMVFCVCDEGTIDCVATIIDKLCAYP